MQRLHESRAYERKYLTMSQRHCNSFTTDATQCYMYFNDNGTKWPLQQLCLALKMTLVPLYNRHGAGAGASRAEELK